MPPVELTPFLLALSERLDAFERTLSGITDRLAHVEDALANGSR